MDLIDICEENFEDNIYREEEDIEENVNAALELNELKSLIEYCGSKPIVDLHLNIVKILKETPISAPDSDKIRAELTSHYLSLLAEVFPWFDPARPGRYWTEWEPRLADAEQFRHSPGSRGRAFTIRPPRPEHRYAARKRKASEETADAGAGPGAQCGLCGLAGDRPSQLAGRLLPARYGEWIHLNCALWSGEVWEEEEGGLQNVAGAATRGRALTCTQCGQRGATVGCCHEKCTENFHFECGLLAQADYKQDKTVYCLKHAQRYASKENVESFLADRRVWVDWRAGEERGRKRPRLQDFRQLQFSCGGLQVERLGCLVAASDTPAALVPVGYQAVRSFWSVRQPDRVVRYRCTTR